MEFEIHDLGCDSYKRVAELNRLMGSHSPASDLRQVGGFLRALNDHVVTWR